MARAAAMTTSAPRTPADVAAVWQAGRAQRQVEEGDMAENWTGWDSEHPWEREALDHVRPYVEGAPGYWALTSFSFTALTGRTRECDLLVVAPSGLHLIEVKSHPGRAVSQGSTWIFERGRPVENPQALGEQKAKELKAFLLHLAEREGIRLPRFWVTASTFLSAPDLRCEFAEHQKLNVFGREGISEQTGLDGIWSGLLALPPRGDRLKPADVSRIAKLLHPAAMGQSHRELRVGPYLLERRPLEEGPTWRDHLAIHTGHPTNPQRRVRIYNTHGELEEEREAANRAATREFLAAHGIRHPGIVETDQIDPDSLDEGPAVVFFHDKDWIRLDEYLRRKGEDLDLDTRVYMIRQLTDALGFAHKNGLFHRALAARGIWVAKPDSRYPKLRIADWQTAASAAPVAGASVLASNLRSLAAHLEPAAGLYLAPEFAYPESDKRGLDVFGLGALAYTIACGQAPADSMTDLHERVEKEQGLNLQSRVDDIPDKLNDLVRRATKYGPTERTATVADFGRELDDLEAQLAGASDPDPLQARKGEAFGDFRVKEVLGTGSSGRALLVERAGKDEVLKVALPDSGPEQLRREAGYLRLCNSLRVIKALEDPIALPHDRWGLRLEYAGPQSLGDKLRSEGPLSLEELRRLGDDLFTILEALEDASVFHRDLKPDNFGLRELGSPPQERLTLFDFSLACSAAQSNPSDSSGTPGYIDPYLGTGNRIEYDFAAERYATAATLYAMATSEEPGRIEDREDGGISLAVDLFEPSIKNGLTAFFQRAFHHDAVQRFSDRVDMRYAWSQVFLSPVVGPSDPVRLDTGEVGRDTPLRSTELDLDAVSAAETKLKTFTVGDLINLSVKRIEMARGVGRNARRHLLRERRRWLQQLPPPATVRSKESPPPADGLLPVDQIAELFIPRQSKDPQLVRILELYFALAPEQVDGSESSWLTDARIAQIVGVDVGKVATSLKSGYERVRSGKVKGIGGLQETLLGADRPDEGPQPGLLEQHGRIMPIERLAAALYEVHGSTNESRSLSLASARACIRALMLVEDRRNEPRFEVVTGLDASRWLVALASENENQPTEDELRDWSRGLAGAARRLVEGVVEGRPLPQAGEVRSMLRNVPAPEPTPALSDRDLVELACGSVENIGITPRLELYPLNLPAPRAIRVSGITSRLGEFTPYRELVEQVRLRFPDLATLPADIAFSRFEQLLLACDLKVEGKSGRLRLRAPHTTRKRAPSAAGIHTPAALIDPQLDLARKEGGFLAIRTSLGSADAIAQRLASKPEVTALNVTELYIRYLRDAREAQAAKRGGRPTWPAVLRADAPDASPAAREGLRQLNATAWDAIRERVVAVDGTVLLHEAAPLARMAGGMDLLREFIGGARQRSTPFGLWLMCPMWNYEQSAVLDGVSVGALEVDSEQLPISSDYLAAA
jgi:serine/threonine protein kinase